MALFDDDAGFDCETLVREFDAVFTSENRVLIVIHNSPDPDAIASASTLKYFLERKYGLEASVAFGGTVGRAENRTMVKRLRIAMKRLGRLKISKYDRIAFVDTQPGAGNHALPPGRKCHLVIDHHPRRRNTRADLVIVRPDIGATATILVELVKACGLDLPATLATALSYAISTETQNMKREASRLDLDAYLWVYTRSNMRMLGSILHPRLSRSHFATLLAALTSAVSFRNLIFIPLGDVPQPEIVSEMADYFLRHERIGWVFAAGRHRDSLILSLRSAGGKKSAGTVIRHITGDPVNAGGHDQVAGGFITIEKLRREEVEALERKLAAGFAAQMGYPEAEWKGLLVEDKAEDRKPG